MCSETQFSLRWNNFGSTMTSALNTLQQLGDFVDVTIAAEGMQLKAHKVVLSACSPYFRQILKSNPCQHPVIILKEVNIEDLESVLTFMYEGEVNITQPRLHTFMHLAEALQIKGLTESNSSSYSSLNQSSNSENQRRMVISDSNTPTLDLTKKVNPLPSPRQEHPSSFNSNPARNNYHYTEEHRKQALHLASTRDSPSPVTPMSKRRRLSVSSDGGPLTQHNADKSSPQTRGSMQNLLEVKLEPDEFRDEGKENGAQMLVDNPSREQSDLHIPAELEPPKSSAVRDSQSVAPKKSNAFTPSKLSEQTAAASDKRGNLVVPRAEKQPVNYQPEFPQDPSCLHSLPYPCPFCDKSYTSWGFRRRHIKGYHTSTPELPCKWCLLVLPSHQEWESHVTRFHRLSLSDARNGILILEEAHMVLQIAQPTRIDSLMELIKNKKLTKDKDKDKNKDKEGPPDPQGGEKV